MAPCLGTHVTQPTGDGATPLVTTPGAPPLQSWVLGIPLHLPPSRLSSFGNVEINILLQSFSPSQQRLRTTSFSML